MKYVIVGCGRFGAELALCFQRKDHDVVVVDSSPAAFDKLHADFRGRTVQGNALEPDVLERASLREADGLAAVTDSDCVNAVVARVASLAFGVTNVVARNYSPSWLPMHEAFGLRVVGSTTWGAERVEEMLESAAGVSPAKGV